MSFCRFAEGAAMFGTTPIENMFLIEYMYDAPATALKVYLYARMLALHPELGEGIGDVAKALRMDEDAILEAFDYWERWGLVRRVSDNPPAYELIALQGQASELSAMDRKMYAYREFHGKLQNLFGTNMIGDHEYRKAGDWLNILGFEQEAVVRIIDFGIRSSKSKSPKPASVFRRMDQFAEDLSKQGLRPTEEVERAIAEEESIAPIARKVLKKLGIPRQPSEPELDSVRRWVQEWGYDQAQILTACDETTNSRNPSFGYLEAILQNRREGDPEAHRALMEVLRELDPAAAQPSPDDRKRYQKLLDDGFSPELIRLAAVQCHRQRQHRLDDVEWRLSVWRKDGVHTPEEADAYMKQMAAYARQLRGVLRRAGSDRRPGYGEIETYRGWKERYPDELIGYAAECSQRAGGSMAYMEKLLAAWQEAGVTTLEAARAQHEAWRANAAAQAAPGAAQANPALNYQQREYRDEDFGDDFFEDLTKYAEEGDRK